MPSSMPDHATHRFDGQIAVVTGAGSGIGAATARRLSAEGATVAALDIDVGAGQRVASDLASARAYPVDVSVSASVDAAVAAVESDLGPIDLLAHIAGVDADRSIKLRLAEHHRSLVSGTSDGGFRGVVELSDAEWDRVMRTNLDGTFYVTRAVLRSMIPRRGGAIVTTSSTTGMSGSAGVAHYSASKGGVRVFTQALAKEVAPFGVRVNAISPGATATAMLSRTPADALSGAGLIPIGRVAEPDELASAFAFLLSTDASYIVGETLNVNGGMVIQ